MTAVTPTPTGFRSALIHDLLASVVVFLVALPLCMSISIASGLPPLAGIITGIVGGIVAGVLAVSPLQVSGPAAGLTVLVWQLVQQRGVEMLGVIVLRRRSASVRGRHLQARAVVPGGVAGGHTRHAGRHGVLILEIRIEDD